MSGSCHNLNLANWFVHCATPLSYTPYIAHTREHAQLYPWLLADRPLCAPHDSRSLTRTPRYLCAASGLHRNEIDGANRGWVDAWCIDTPATHTVDRVAVLVQNRHKQRRVHGHAVLLASNNDEPQAPLMRVNTSDNPNTDLFATNQPTNQEFNQINVLCVQGHSHPTSNPPATTLVPAASAWTHACVAEPVGWWW